MITRTLRAPRPAFTMQPLGKHALRHPSGVHAVDQSPLPEDFRPKHCAGESDDNNGCLHMHPGDSMCACGRVIIPASVDARLLRPGDSPALLGPTYRHSTFGCSAVSASSVSA